MLANNPSVFVSLANTTAGFWFFLGNSYTNYCLNVDLMRGVRVWGCSMHTEAEGFLTVSALSVRLDKGEVTALKSLLCALDSVLAALGGAKGGPMWKCEKGHTACYPEFPMAVCELGHGQLFMC